MNTWLYNGAAFEVPKEEHYGFVYNITNLQTGRQYIGKKLFWFKKTKILKKKKVRYLAESDWKTYYGSSIELKKDVALIGEDNFKREILHLCSSKGECSYHEAREQIIRDVLFKPELYYNDWVICRIHRKHVLDQSGNKQTTSKSKLIPKPS
jgi:hypothetical protein